MSDIRLAFSSGVEFCALNDYASINGWTSTTPSDHPIPSPDVREADAYIFTWQVNDSVTARFVDDEVTEVQFIVFSGYPLHEASSSLAENFAVSNDEDCLPELAQNISGVAHVKLASISPLDVAKAVAVQQRQGNSDALVRRKAGGSRMGWAFER